MSAGRAASEKAFELASPDCSNIKAGMSTEKFAAYLRENNFHTTEEMWGSTWIVQPDGKVHCSVEIAAGQVSSVSSVIFLVSKKPAD